MKRTPLFDVHKKEKAKLVGFSGWEMPLSYAGVIEEHRTVRNHVGLFDISHMGRFRVEGEDALPFLQKMTTNDVQRITKGRAQYSLILNENGGILDDIFVYQVDASRYLLCVNASNTEKIFKWLMAHSKDFSVSVIDRTPETGLLALQGPRSIEVIKKLTSDRIAGLKLHAFEEGEVAGVNVLAARTGYTGETGFELFLEGSDLSRLWHALMEAGRPEGIRPIGLGARDTLRLEMGYCLYGHEIDEETTPLEAGLKWVVPPEKGVFIGQEALKRKEAEGFQKKLIGFELIQRGVPRQGYLLFSEGREIGAVTSGNHSPTLGKGIGLGYVVPAFAETGGEILVEIRGKTVPAEIVGLPFYKRKGKTHKKES